MPPWAPLQGALWLAGSPERTPVQGAPEYDQENRWPQRLEMGPPGYGASSLHKNPQCKEEALPTEAKGTQACGVPTPCVGRSVQQRGWV